MTEMDQTELVSTAQMTELEQNVLAAFSDQPIDLLNRIIAFIKERDRTRLQHDTAGLTEEERVVISHAREHGDECEDKLIAIISRLTVTERTGGEDNDPGGWLAREEYLDSIGAKPANERTGAEEKPPIDQEEMARVREILNTTIVPPPQPAPPREEHDPDLTTEGLARIKMRSLPSAEVIAEIESFLKYEQGANISMRSPEVTAIRYSRACNYLQNLLSLLKARAGTMEVCVLCGVKPRADGLCAYDVSSTGSAKAMHSQCPLR